MMYCHANLDRSDISLASLARAAWHSIGQSARQRLPRSPQKFAAGRAADWPLDITQYGQSQVAAIDVCPSQSQSTHIRETLSP